MVGETGLSVIIAVLTVVAALVSYGFAWYSWDRATHPISDIYAALLVADGSWALFAFLGYISPTDAIASIWPALITLSAYFVTVFWFMFVVRYTGDDEWVPSVVERALAGIAGVYTLLFILNPGQLIHPASGVGRYGLLRLPYPEPGPGLLVNTTFTYLVLLTTFVLLGRFLLRSRNLYRKQAAIIFGTTLVVTLSTVLYLTGFSPDPQLVLTPVFFIVQAVGIGAALYRYDFLDVAPMAANTLLEEISDPVFVLNTKDRLVDWNRAADAYVERDDGRTVLDDIAIAELPAALTATDGGAGPDTATVTTTRPNDVQERVTFDVRTTPIEDRYGIVRGLAVVLRDVTAQEQRKRALETQNERLEEFTGVVSHDLRNPLQLIDGKIRLARQTGDFDHLADASNAVDRMERMLDELLTLARQGQTIAETEPIALAECCRTAWDGVATDDATLVADTERTVAADAARLQRLFENLFRNSVEHAGPDVTVTVGDTDRGFYVADDGPGIPVDQWDAIFEFGTTFAEDGTGFGLAIVETVVEAHGWSITAGESEAGGARFDVALADNDQFHPDDSPLGDDA